MNDYEPQSPIGAEPRQRFDAAPLSEVVERYCATNHRVRSERTVNAYRQVAKAWDEMLGRPATTADLTELNFGRWVKRRQEKVNNNTVNGEASTLVSLWRWCALRQLAPPPLVVMPERDIRAPQALTREQVDRLWHFASNNNAHIAGVPGNVYWPALLNVCWQTAERIGAVLGLQWEWINLREGWVRFPPETRKGGRYELVRPINETAVGRLRVLAKYAPDLPFGIVNRSSFYHHWHALRIMADLPKWASPHTIRKSHASHLAAMGGDATESLGHSTRRITRQHYLDPTIADNRRHLELLPDPDAKPSLLGRLFGK